MVDATVATGAARPVSRTTGSARTGALDIAIDGPTPVAIETYAALARQAFCAPAQSEPWVRGWLQTVEPDAIIATISKGGEPVCALALEVVRRGPFRVARLLGGSHANGNWPPAAPQGMDGLAAWLGHLAAQIRRDRKDIDVLLLERLNPDHAGAENPLLTFASSASPNPSLAVDLTGGFEALLARSSGKRKRKKHRSQTRKFEAAGGFRRIEASSAEEVDRILQAFFAMKAARFRRAGIGDVFADHKVQAFFRKLFVDALASTPRRFVLHALEVGGTLRAITGSSRFGDRIVCEFGAIVEDELAHASPGDFLFFENIKEACDQGLAVYDFSVGDELYKRLWCDIETRQHDVIVPLSAKGKALSLALAGSTRLKTWVKANEKLWKIVKSLRRRNASQQNPIQPSED